MRFLKVLGNRIWKTIKDKETISPNYKFKDQGVKLAKIRNEEIVVSSNNYVYRNVDTWVQQKIPTAMNPRDQKLMSKAIYSEVARKKKAIPWLYEYFNDDLNEEHLGK